MEKEQIIEIIRNLPRKVVGELSEDHQIFEGNQDGAHFKITKEIVPVSGNLAIYSLSVSGNVSSKDKIISEFITVLGKPIGISSPEDFPGIDFVIWNAVEVDYQLQSTN